MSDDQVENSELLVHASAPTSRADDERYRAQALACLNFQPAKRRILGSVLVGGEGKRGCDRAEDGSSRGKRARLMEDDRDEERSPAQSLEVIKTPARRGRSSKREAETGMLRGLAQCIVFLRVCQISYHWDPSLMLRVLQLYRLHPERLREDFLRRLLRLPPRW